MNRSFLLGFATGVAACLAVVLLLGIVFAVQIGRAGRLFKEEPVTAAPAAPAAPAPGAPAGGAPLDAREQIAAAQTVVQQDPKNLQAWIALGNLYFDTHQHEKSIDAYARALELKPDDPNVLTDQGIMFRAVGAFDKAIANFQKASQIDPGHLQSLFNLGVVYGYDLKNLPKAEEAWNRLIQLAPSSENAKQARQAMAELRGK